MGTALQNRSALLWLITGLTVVISGFWALMNLMEWYTVGVQGNTAGYPFGGEGPVPEYYSSAERYSNTVLCWSFPFIALLGTALWCFFKRKEQGAFVCLGLTLLAWLLMFMHGLSD